MVREGVEETRGGGRGDIHSIVTGELMSSDFTLVATDTPIDEILTLVSGKSCPDLLVIDQEGIFRGVITPFDLMMHLNPVIGVRTRRKAPCIECMITGNALTAEDIMSRGHLSARKETPVVEVLRLLEKYHHPNLVVVDERGKPVGVIGICGIIAHLRIVGHL
jgi:CBS domain-containing protein